MAFVALYDANVLYPDALRDLLVRLAGTRLFRAHITEKILDEMVAALLRNRPDLNAERLARTRELIVRAMPDCLVVNYEEFITALTLPDPDDRHVLAAAVRCGAQVIVTNNLRDFPESALTRYGIQAQSPDTFVTHLLELSPLTIREILREMAEDKKRPPMTAIQVVDSLERSGLSACANALRKLLSTEV